MPQTETGELGEDMVDDDREGQPAIVPGAEGSTMPEAKPMIDDASKTALNGAQVTSMLELLRAAGAGEIPRQSAVNMIRVAFNLDEGQAEAYGEVFAKTPMIGFSTYGEACIGHINQTSTMLVFQ